MATAGDLIQDSMELLGVYAPGETMAAADSARCLSALNDMLDTWSNLTLSCYTINETSFSLVAMKAKYTIGTGGDINVARPIKLVDGPGAAYVQDTNGNNYPVNVVQRDQWNLLGNRSNIVTSNFPDTLFYDPQYPLGVINVFPFPNIAYTMFFGNYLPLSNLSSLTTVLSLPPGYKRAITTNLAVIAQPYFASSQLNPLILAEALKTHGDIKRTNMRPNVAVMSPELVSRANIGYNIYTDAVGNTSGSG